MLLTVRLNNETGYTWDGIGVAVDWADVAIYDLSQTVVDGYGVGTDDCWNEWSMGSEVPIYGRARDTDGDCYSPSSRTITVAEEVTTTFTITANDYEGGGCP
jgi:hypothetical protein